MHSVFVFLFFTESDGQTDVLRMWKVSWHDRRGRNLWPHLKRDYCWGKERERDKQTNKQTKKRVRRRGKGENGADHELTEWLPSLLDAHRPERLCGFKQPDEEQKGERFSRRSSPGLS